MTPVLEGLVGHVVALIIQGFTVCRIFFFFFLTYPGSARKTRQVSSEKPRKEPQDAQPAAGLNPQIKSELAP